MNFRSKIAKGFRVLMLLLVGMMVYAASTGQLTSLPQKILGAAAVPFQKLTSAISYQIEAWTDKTFDVDSILRENEELKKQLTLMRSKQFDYDRIAMENEEFKKIFGTQEKRSEYKTVGANVIGRDGVNMFYSFTIDKGESDGIEVDDVVISSEGLVGVVVETGPNFAKVSTVLSPNVKIGCIAGEERDVGVVSGSFDLAEREMCSIDYLPKETKLKKGDLVGTSGYGNIFPPDLVIGTVEEVVINDSGSSAKATLKPAADISNVKVVLVITDF